MTEDCIGLVFYFKNASSPMLFEMSRQSAHDFIRDNVIPCFDFGSGILRMRMAGSEAIMGEVRMSEVVGWQMVERKKETWQT